MHNCWNLNELALKLGASDNALYTHGLEALLSTMPRLNRSLRESKDNWRLFASHVNLWKPAWRYNPAPLNVDWTSKFVEAVERVYRWLDANRA